LFDDALSVPHQVSSASIATHFGLDGPGIESKKKFDDDDEVQEEVVAWFKWLAADFYESGIQKLLPRLDKCLDNAGDYVEK
jgi:hypothetical protein